MAKKKRARKLKDERAYVPIDPKGKVQWRFAAAKKIDVERLVCWMSEIPITHWKKLAKKGWRLGRCELIMIADPML